MQPLACAFRDHAPWRWLEEPLAPTPAAGLERDRELVNAVARGEQPATARLWENPHSLIVTRQEARLPAFAAACRTLKDEGIPVLVRESGGTAVPHEPGILHLSLLFPLQADERYDLDLTYQMLCEPLRIALKALNIDAHYGSVAGSFCDGRYNLVVKGRKVTGTAQRLISAGKGAGRPTRAVLAQAMLMVDCDAQAGTDQVNRFYQLAGGTRCYDPAASASVSQLLASAGRPVPETLRVQLRSEISTAFRQLTG